MSKERTVLMGVLGALPAGASKAEVADAILAKFTLVNPGLYHGTYARWQIHYKQGTEPCKPCVQARRAYSERLRARRAEKTRPVKTEGEDSARS